MKNLYSYFLALFALIIGILWSCSGPDNDIAFDNSKDNHWEQADFVGSQTCVQCHESEYKDWTGSHHQQAMAEASDETVLGNFDDFTFNSNGVKTRFFRKDDKFFVNTISDDGEYQDLEVSYVFGLYPLQQYLIKFPDGSVQCLQVAWDSKDNKWYDLQPDLTIKTDEWIHWTNGGMRWNTMCADCHSTDLKKEFSIEDETYATTYAEINVSCEACHGPSSNHVEFYQYPGKYESAPELYMTKNMDSKEVVDKCARCHSRRSQLTKHFDYEGTFDDHYQLALLENHLYHQDGQIKDEVYVYGSFVQSKMYHNSVSCVDCHDPHTQKLKAEGNKLCLTCHESSYDNSSHHFHKEESKGQNCIECHMPGKYYMGNDFRRDHSFRVPRPDLSVKYGTPNSCTGCHQDKSDQWAATAIENHFGTDRADHFSDHLLSSIKGDVASSIHLLSNAKYPDITRATAMSHLVSNIAPNTDLDQFARYLADPSPMVRIEAIVLFQNGGATYSRYIIPLLQDPVRSVRVQAAQFFHLVANGSQNSEEFKKADKELEEYISINADMSSGQFLKAILLESKGQIPEAIKAYDKAFELDNYRTPPLMNLAMLYYNQGNFAKTEECYLRVIEINPNHDYAHYSLGLLYHEMNKNDLAVEYLKKAHNLPNPSPNTFYNYALILASQNKQQEADRVLNKGINKHPYSEKLLYLKLNNQINAKQYSEAKKTCQKLIDLNPSEQNYQGIMQNLNSL